MSKSRSPMMQTRQDGGVGPLVLMNVREFGPGNVFFVQSTNTNAGDSAGKGMTPDAPFATIDYAIGQCTANQGDLIIVLPGHADTVSAAGGIAADVAGVTIQGIGTGSLKPTITFSTVTTATFTVSAANVTIRGVRVKTTIDALVSMFVVSAAYCTLDDVEFVDNSATAACLQFCLTTAAADYLTIKNCFHYQANSPASVSSWIELVGCDCPRILDNVFFLALRDSASTFTINGSTAVVYCEIARNVFVQSPTATTQTKIVTLASGSTGFVHDNRAASGTGVSTAGAFDIASAYAAENYWCDTALKSGLLAPVVDTDT